MNRNGKALRTLDAGDKRRVYDARNAWRKMTPAQRADVLSWIMSDADHNLVEWEGTDAIVTKVGLNVETGTGPGRAWIMGEVL